MAFQDYAHSLEHVQSVRAKDGHVAHCSTRPKWLFQASVWNTELTGKDMGAPLPTGHQLHISDQKTALDL